MARWGWQRPGAKREAAWGSWMVACLLIDFWFARLQALVHGCPAHNGTCPCAAQRGRGGERAAAAGQAAAAGGGGVAGGGGGRAREEGIALLLMIYITFDIDDICI